MKIGFDLDGTLDRPQILALAKALLAAGHEVHVITGVFLEAADWQDGDAKRKKLLRLGLPFKENPATASEHASQRAVLHILSAVPATFDRDYRLADLGLRKGELCERLGIELFIDDSEKYVEMIPKMAGGTSVLHVRN